MQTPKIYESPDGGKTVYARDFGAPPNLRVLVKSAEKKVVLVTGGFDPLIQYGENCIEEDIERK